MGGEEPVVDGDKLSGFHVIVTLVPVAVVVLGGQYEHIIMLGA